MKHIVVGVDTGKTCAVACVDLNGNIVSLKTKRFAGLNWIVQVVTEAGSPVVVASDKKHANTQLAKLAAIFDAALFTPKDDISVSRKKEFMLPKKAANLHERDALTAAMSAYNAYSSKLNQIEHLAREKGVDDIDGVKALVVKKHSFHEAVTGKKTGRFVR
ncbi:MAG: DUF460 domain-containing protein [Candidatus Marsarchaeota archaeon]|jgi:predicted RNase H-like nuclease (RuvC/YqgF family)|nr:DUF460 domain-containing protein [Candidatus Marsarchaeota archaeon]